MTIAVSRGFATGFVITPVDLGPMSRGRVQALRFSSILFPHDPRASFLVVNVYLQAGGTNGVRLGQLETIFGLDADLPLFLLGDFNMVETTSDAPGPRSGIILGGLEKERWDRFILHFKLREVVQDSHTHFFTAAVPEDCRSSRIDRVYTSLKEEELAVLCPGAETVTPQARGKGWGDTGAPPAFFPQKASLASPSRYC